MARVRKEVAMSRYVQIRLTVWSHKRLGQAYQRLCEAVEANPERYPGYAGRALTYSDVIILLCEEKCND